MAIQPTIPPWPQEFFNTITCMLVYRTSSLTAGLEARGLGLLLRSYDQYSDGLIWATPGLDSLFRLKSVW